MNLPLVVVTHKVDAAQRQAYGEGLSGTAEILFADDLDAAARASALRRAAVLAGWVPHREIAAGEMAELGKLRLLQVMAAGVDKIPFARFPPHLAVGYNPGTAAQPIAEHAAALILAAAKRLVPKHIKMARGEFDQNSSNRMLAGGVCGILGYGGIGKATARIMRGIGMRIHAISRSARPDGEAEFVGSLDDLDKVLAASDVLVIALPLNDATRGLIGRRELALMKRDAILVNVSRAHILREAELYWHLSDNPEFCAGLDPWWIEPLTHGTFRLDHPFFDLPNVVGSPHNSGNVPGIFAVLARSAADNIRRFLRGEPGVRLVHADDRLSVPTSEGYL